LFKTIFLAQMMTPSAKYLKVIGRILFAKMAPVISPSFADLEKQTFMYNAASANVGSQLPCGGAVHNF